MRAAIHGGSPVKNSVGTGPYSSMNFVVSVTPGPVQRISPTGTITQRQPSLTWQRNLDVSWYGLWLGGPRDRFFRSGITQQRLQYHQPARLPSPATYLRAPIAGG